MKRFVTPAPRASCGVLRNSRLLLRPIAARHAGKRESPILSRASPRQFALFPLPSREIKSRKKLDHGESRAVLFAQRNKFLALPKSHNFTSSMLTNRQGETLFGGPAWQKRKAALTGGLAG